ncbi:MAG: HEAT repeat domain-containing protein [Armatimonadetes bacterium]|nr:HEAT repeat domain-containing protein [Armatimonadota bacterium]
MNTSASKMETALDMHVLRLRDICQGAEAELSRTDHPTDFPMKLTAFLKEHKNKAIRALDSIFSEIDREVASEVLFWVGEADDEDTYRKRRQLLLKHMSNRSPAIRNSAILALANMDGAKAIPDLKEALQREKIAWVKEKIAQVVEQLENPSAWRFC